MRIVITGMGGAIGTGIAQKLERDPDNEILGVDMVPPRRHLRRSEFHLVRPGEVAVRTRLIRDFDPEVIIHMGVYEPHARSNPVDSTRRTRAVTRSVFHAGLDCGSLRHVVVRSGIEVYGREHGTALRPDEEAPINPTTRFGRALAEVEESARAFSSLRDIPVTVLRFAPIVGPYIPSPLGRYLRLPVVPVAATSDAPIQLIHIDDVHDATVAAVRERIGGVFNIVGEGAVTGSQAARLGKRLVMPVWGPGWNVSKLVTAVFGAPLPDHTIEAMSRGQTADGSKAHTSLDFVPGRTTRECVEDLYEWASIIRVDVDRDVA